MFSFAKLFLIQVILHPFKNVFKPTIQEPPAFIILFCNCMYYFIWTLIPQEIMKHFPDVLISFFFFFLVCQKPMINFDKAKLLIIFNVVWFSFWADLFSHHFHLFIIITSPISCGLWENFTPSTATSLFPNYFCHIFCLYRIFSILSKLLLSYQHLNKSRRHSHIVWKHFKENI